MNNIGYVHCVCQNANISWHGAHSFFVRYNKLRPVLKTTLNPSLELQKKQKTMKLQLYLTLILIQLLKSICYSIRYEIWQGLSIAWNVGVIPSDFVEIRNSTILAHTFYISKLFRMACCDKQLLLPWSHLLSTRSIQRIHTLLISVCAITPCDTFQY